MTPTLTDDLRQALAREPGQPLELEDPVTHARYVLIQLDVYERLQQAMNEDGSDLNPRAFYPAFAEAIQGDLDAPGMERYDEEGASPDEP